MVPDPDGVLGWNKVFLRNFPGSPGERELDHLAAEEGRIAPQNAQLLVSICRFSRRSGLCGSVEPGRQRHRGNGFGDRRGGGRLGLRSLACGFQINCGKLSVCGNGSRCYPLDLSR